MSLWCSIKNYNLNQFFFKCALGRFCWKSCQDILVSISKGSLIFSYSSGGVYFQDAEANIFGATDCKHCSCPSGYSGLGWTAFFHLELVLCKNCVSMGAELVNAILFLKTNKCAWRCAWRCLYLQNLCPEFWHHLINTHSVCHFLWIFSIRYWITTS